MSHERGPSCEEVVKGRVEKGRGGMDGGGELRRRGPKWVGLERGEARRPSDAAGDRSEGKGYRCIVIYVDEEKEQSERRERRRGRRCEWTESYREKKG